MEQYLEVDGNLKEIKKTRRTVILGSDLTLPVNDIRNAGPLTPPLSERASADVAELFDPEKGERYESVDLSSEDEGEWNRAVTPNIEEETVEELVTDSELSPKSTANPTFNSLRTILESPHKPLPPTSSLPSPPPMTIHDFWVNVVRNYKLVHRTMPAFLFHKIRDGGIPSVLRRVVWTAMAGVTPEYGMEMNNIYARLEVGGISGWDKDIGRDLNRTWPDVDMFKEQDGEGQRGLRGVLGGYSVWDHEVGYCQGLGFLAGPLLMHSSSPAEAFTLLAVLMSEPSTSSSNATTPAGYSLRTLYTPNFPGLLSLIYSFNAILKEQLPTLENHLVSMGLTTEMYAPQWFLSMFAVTGAPVESILLRIWDLLMMEGSHGGNTLIRLGIALMRLNQDKLLELTEMEDGLKLLLSKSLWNQVQPDTLIDIAGGELKTLIPNTKLEELDQESNTTSKTVEKKVGRELQAVVGRFFGRLKATASQLSVETTNLVAPPMLRSLSRASFSLSPQDNELPTPTLLRSQTEGVLMSRSPSAASVRGTSENERALHAQIEELVKLLGDVQRRIGESEMEKDSLKTENSKLREILSRVANVMPSSPIIEDLNITEPSISLTTLNDEISGILSTATSPASSISNYSDSSIEEDLRTQLTETQHTLNQERQANALLQQQLSTTETELSRTRSALLELRSRQYDIPRSPSRSRSPASESMPRSPNNTSLRELKLVVKTEGSLKGSPVGSASTPSAGSNGGWSSWFGRN